MFKKVKCASLAALALLMVCAYLSGALLPDKVSVFAADGPVAVEDKLQTLACTATVEGDSATVRLLGLLPVKSVALNVVSENKLYVGGNAFGLKYFTKGVLVVSLTQVEGFGAALCPAEDAGIKKGDVVLSVNDTEIEDAQSFSALVADCGGKALKLTVKRGDKSFNTIIYPALSAEDNSYRCGMYVRDSIAGIGTITYITADGKSFAGLGHGIYDGESGALMPGGQGAVVDVEIKGVRKGAPGSPGELKGNIGKEKQGTVLYNKETGIYGTWDVPVEGLGEPMPVGLSDTVKEGKAYIYSSVDGTRQKYGIEIEKIYKDGGNTRNFLIRITDKKLLTKTGGIVQGMSVCYNKTNTKKTA